MQKISSQIVSIFWFFIENKLYHEFLLIDPDENLKNVHPNKREDNFDILCMGFYFIHNIYIERQI